MKACYSNYIYGPWLPLGREAAWNPEAGVQLTPIESVISQDCQVGDALAAQNKRMLIQCFSSASLFDIRAALPLCRPLLGWAGAELPVLFLVSNQSARKLQQQSKIEVTAQEWTNWNRLLWNLQAFADTCWSTACTSFYLPNPFFTTLLTAAYDSRNTQAIQLYSSLLSSLVRNRSVCKIFEKNPNNQLLIIKG